VKRRKVFETYEALIEGLYNKKKAGADPTPGAKKKAEASAE